MSAFDRLVWPGIFGIAVVDLSDVQGASPRFRLSFFLPEHAVSVRLSFFIMHTCRAFVKPAGKKPTSPSKKRREGRKCSQYFYSP